MQITKEITPEHYERYFRRAKKITHIGLGILAALLVLTIFFWRNLWPEFLHVHPGPFFTTHPLIGCALIAIGIVGLSLFYAGGETLSELYEICIKDAEIETAEKIASQMLGQKFRRLGFRLFILSHGLQDFKQTALKHYQRLREDAIRTKHMEQQLQESTAFLEKYEELKRQFEEAVLMIVNEARVDYYRSRFKSARSFEEIRTIMRDIKSESAGTTTRGNGQAAKRERLRRMLDEMTAEGICPEAKTLLRQTETVSSMKQEIALLTRAITAQKETNKRRAALIEPDPDDLPRVSLPNEAQPSLSELFPDEVDGEMADQILAVLADSGDERHEALRLRTATNYRNTLKKSFPTESFDDTLAWLIRERIIFDKAEKNRRAYVLNTKPSWCASRPAAEIVRKIAVTA